LVETKRGRRKNRSSSPAAKANLALAMCAILSLCSSPGAEAFTQFASTNTSTACVDYRYEGGQFALAAHSSPAFLSVNFSDELIKIAEKQEANPSLNVIQPPSGNVASCDKVHYADGPRIDASILVFDTNRAKKRAWNLNVEVFPRSADYFNELKTFFHQDECTSNAPVSLDSEPARILSALLSVACVGRHGRSYIVDSGASHHLISRGALSDQERKTVRKAKVAIPLQTANQQI